MADVRALLRQKRAARRVDHPHAVYSDTGKLSCSVCREPVRTDAAWDDHVRSALHRTSVTFAQQQQPGATAALSVTDSNKRRRGSASAGAGAGAGSGGGGADDNDVEMDDNGGGDDDDDDDVRGKKRPRSAVTPPAATTTLTGLSQQPQIQIQVSDGSKSSTGDAPPPSRKLSAQLTLTPPLGRRTSGTPVQGVEMRIPSRPATPITTTKEGFMSNANGNTNGNGNVNGSANGGPVVFPFSSMTPKVGQLGRSPLVPQDEFGKPASSASAAVSAAAALSAATSSPSAAAPVPQQPDAPDAAAPTVDEDEWAAFEADVVNAPAPAPVPSTAKPDFGAAGVISAAPVLAAAADGASHGEETERRAAEEAKREDEREDATRTLEDEFAEMQELESRVRKLREKREALRSQTHPRTGNMVYFTAAPSVAPAAAAAPADATRSGSASMIDKENIRSQLAAVQKRRAAGGNGDAAVASEDDEEEDEDDEDEDADWNVFRFTA